MSLGTGYEYVMRSVVRGDHERLAGVPLTRYYTESGTPPGRWIGTGLAGLNGGSGLEPGSVVTGEQLFRLLGMLTDPISGEPLGQQARFRASANGSRAVAGFDLTFSVPKSVSAVWAVAGPEIQAEIHRAHKDAIALSLTWAEQHIVFTRTGRNGIVQEDVRGLIAAAFDHWDSRAGDPHLHTHVVVANRVQTPDGKWRTLDGATLFKYAVALSELHEGVLTDLLSQRLGYTWDQRTRQHSATPRLDVAGVPDELIRDFSRRSGHIEAAMPEIIATFVKQHGRQPGPTEMIRLRQQATLQTRPDKEHRNLGEQMQTWRSRAASLIGSEPADWAVGLQHGTVPSVLSLGCIDDQFLADLAGAALAAVSARRATFTHANVLAEVHRQLHGTRFETPADRLQIGDRVSRIALEQVVLLTPDSLAPTPEHLLRADGTSKLRHGGAEVYTTRGILDAESRLLDAGRTLGAPALTVDDLTSAADATALATEQLAAVHAVARSGRVLDVLVGPAGAGKTTTLATLADAWCEAYGADSVIGLAPSAAAAEVLGNALGIRTDNTAKWLVEHARNAERDRFLVTNGPAVLYGAETANRALRERVYATLDERDRWDIRPGQLVIVDEASLAGTRTLDTVTAVARANQAKMLLVGDWAQLSAVDAGGAFAMLCHDRPDVPELRSVHRFEHAWERDASLQLRVGDLSAIDAYLEHDRVRSGQRDDMVDQVFQAWRADVDGERESLMIAADRDSVDALNQRARADRIARGEVEAGGVEIADGHANAGDRIVTRHNERTLCVDGRWVKNGDSWTVVGTGRNGSLMVQRDGDVHSLTLPAEYVRAHVELGYATTVHRAQGRTVDTVHALVDERTTRELLYVAATRGRTDNRLYVVTSDDCPVGPETPAEHSPLEVLRDALQRTSTDTSAHAALRVEAEKARQREAAREQDLSLLPPTLVSRKWVPLDRPREMRGIEL